MAAKMTMIAVLMPDNYHHDYDGMMILSSAQALSTMSKASHTMIQAPSTMLKVPLPMLKVPLLMLQASFAIYKASLAFVKNIKNQEMREHQRKEDPRKKIKLHNTRTKPNVVSLLLLTTASLAP